MKKEQVKIQVQDALDPDPDSVESADVVLLDAPCSGLGIFLGHLPFQFFQRQ